MYFPTWEDAEKFPADTKTWQVVSKKSIARNRGGRFRGADNQLSAASGLDGDCSAHNFLASRVEGALRCAS